MAESTVRLPRSASGHKLQQAKKHTRLESHGEKRKLHGQEEPRRKPENTVSQTAKEAEKVGTKALRDQAKLKRSTRHGRSASHTPSSSPVRAQKDGGSDDDNDAGIFRRHASHTALPRNKSDVILRRNRSGGSLLMMNNPKSTSKPGGKNRAKVAAVAAGMTANRRSFLADQPTKKGSRPAVEDDGGVFASEMLQQEDEGDWMEASTSPSPEVSRIHTPRGSAHPRIYHGQDSMRADDSASSANPVGGRDEEIPTSAPRIRPPPSSHFIPQILPPVTVDYFEPQASHSRPTSPLSPAWSYISTKTDATVDSEMAPRKTSANAYLGLLKGHSNKDGSDLRAAPSAAAVYIDEPFNEGPSGNKYTDHTSENSTVGMTSSFLDNPVAAESHEHNRRMTSAQSSRSISATTTPTEPMKIPERPAAPSPIFSTTDDRPPKHDPLPRYPSHAGLNRTARKRLLDREALERQQRRQASAPISTTDTTPPAPAAATEADNISLLSNPTSDTSSTDLVNGVLPPCPFRNPALNTPPSPTDPKMPPNFTYTPDADSTTSSKSPKLSEHERKAQKALQAIHDKQAEAGKWNQIETPARDTLPADVKDTKGLYEYMRRECNDAGRWFKENPLAAALLRVQKVEKVKSAIRDYRVQAQPQVLTKEQKRDFMYSMMFGMSYEEVMKLGRDKGEKGSGESVRSV